MASAMNDMGDGFVNLGLSKMMGPVSEKLTKLGGIHKQIKILQEEQSQTDMNSIAQTAEECIRTLGSIKIAYLVRSKMYANINANDQILQKKKDSLAKYTTTARVRTDKISTYSAEVAQVYLINPV
jgi:sorting nexin-1/2